MNAAQRLHDRGQSLWLDNLSREILDDGTLDNYIRELALTGLTSNPTIFDKAIRSTKRYDRSIAEAARGAVSDEAVFFELALQDLTRAAALFRPAFDASGGADGWVSLEVSPLPADDTAATIAPRHFMPAPPARTCSSRFQAIAPAFPRSNEPHHHGIEGPQSARKAARRIGAVRRRNGGLARLRVHDRRRAGRGRRARLPMRSACAAGCRDRAMRSPARCRSARQPGAFPTRRRVGSATHPRPAIRR